MQNPSVLQGKYVRMAEAYCAECTNRAYVGGWSVAAIDANLRSKGWSLTKLHGWVCPECKQKLRKGRGKHAE